MDGAWDGSLQADWLLVVATEGRLEVDSQAHDVWSMLSSSCYYLLLLPESLLVCYTREMGRGAEV